MSCFIFVYGTLKAGCVNASFLEKSEFIAYACTKNSFWKMVELQSESELEVTYPGVQPGGYGRIQGEIYKISEDVLRRLDAFEELGYCYERQMVPLDTEDFAWMYIHIKKNQKKCVPKHVFFEEDEAIYSWREG